MIDAARIKNAEDGLGVTFPPVYRAWIRTRNGGTVRFKDETWTVNPIFDDTDRQTMRKTASHVVADTSFVRNYPTFPKGGVSIAQLNVSRLVLVPKADASQLGEQVYYWDPDSDEPELVADDVIALDRR